MVFRHWTLARPNEIYHFYATRLAGNAWSEPLKFTASSSGHNSQHASLALGADGPPLRGVFERRPVAAPSSPPTRCTRCTITSTSPRCPKGEGPPDTTFADAAAAPAPPRGRPCASATP